MNKSKFLKKSLAMVLAIMMVVAMIPLSASAADAGYVPTSVTVKTASDTEGTVTGSGTSWDIEFAYNADYPDTEQPKIVVQTSTVGYTGKVIRLNGTEDDLLDTGTAVEFDADNENAPVPFKFYLVDTNGKKSSVYTVNWTIAEASTDTTVKSAKLAGTYDGVVDNTNKTITFSVPFGYKDVTSNPAWEITTTSSVDDSASDLTDSFSGVIGTNKAEATAEEAKIVAQDGVTEAIYSIYVVENKALSSVKIGDVIGVIEKDEDGLETGDVIFNMPADTKLDDDGNLKLVPVFTIGSSYKEATLAKSPSGTEKIVTGKEFNFADLYNAGDSGLSFVVTSEGTYQRTYKFIMKVDKSSTVITGVSAKATGSSSSVINGLEINGKVDGTALSVELSSKTELNKSIKVSFVGPEGAKIETTGVSSETFNADGKATLTLTGYTKPVEFTVTSADNKYQQYYTLTLTKAAAVVTEPKITSATLTWDKDTDTEFTTTVNPVGNVITFTVPYSVDTSKLTTTTNYSYTTSAFTTATTTIDADPIKNGGSVKATTDSGEFVTYAIKFQKAKAETGKAISDVVITTAENVNLIDYTETYKATVSGKELKISVPKNATTSDYVMNFKVSTGAKLYTFDKTTPTNGTLVNATYDEDGDLAVTATKDTIANITGKIYVVMDETLAVKYAEGALTYTQISNLYPNNFTAYTFDVTETEKIGNSLTAISANDKQVTAEISANKVTFTVPYGYVKNETPFFFDFTVNDGASLKATPSTVELVSGGVKDWDSTAEKVVVADEDETTNPDFKFTDEGSGSSHDYQLQVLTGASTYTKVTNLVVTSEKNVAKTYTYEVKVLPAETGATLTSVKVNNTAANANGKVYSVVLPYGSNLGALPLTLTASKGAEVKVTDASGTPFDYADATEDTTFNFTKDVTVTVTSEDGLTKNTYTIKATVADQFSDVSEDDWFYEYVMQAADLGLVGGVGDGRFAPKSNVKRGDFALMIARMEGYNEDDYTESAFTDIPSDKYYSAAVAYCVEKGYLSGYEDGTFKGEKIITRQEMAKILAMVAGLGEVNEPTSTYADDAKIANWAKGYVYAVTNADLMSGVGNDNFAPTSGTQRCQAATVLVRLAAN